MKIKKISVVNLFDYYCYDIEMKNHDNVSIIHAPNGYGKTTVFNLVKYYLDFDVINMALIPFDKFSIELIDGTVMLAEKYTVDSETARRFEQRIIIFTIIDNQSKKHDFSVPISGAAFAMIKDVGIDDYVRRMEMRRRHVPVEERANEESFNMGKKYRRFNEELEHISDSIRINFIDSNRLFSDNVSSRNYRDDFSENNEDCYFSNDLFTDSVDRDDKEENITRDARDILFQIQAARQLYSMESEQKDRDFPDRLVEYVNKSSECFTDAQIAEELDKLEKKRLKLEKAGLVLSGKKTLTPTASIDDTMRKFYTLYIQDTLEKLSVYDDIKAKIELFMEIINTKTTFSNKKMRIDNEKGIVFEPVFSNTGRTHTIPLEKLSSGEKHDLIMFYELIFNSDGTSVFLIDEPEISLHVAWQMQFIGVLERICELTGTQAIVATHSPDIVNGHDDLLISLGLEDNEDANF